MPDFSLIDTSDKLRQVCEKLKNEIEIALDLEADSLHSYHEKVCLIQLSTRSNNWLIDPFAVKNHDPLAELLRSPKLFTVFHGGDYDIRSLHRDFGITVAQMFDTMIAAQFAGVAEFGLAALLRCYFGVELDKRFQKADWSKRPLSPEMAQYAANDTAHLLQLADILRARLDQLGRTSWVDEECALVTANRMAEKSNSSMYLNCKGAGKLKPRNLAILEELLQFRDSRARELDRPVFKVIPTESLLVIAEKMPLQVQDMNGIVGVTSKIANHYGELLLSSVQRGLAVPESGLPVYPRFRREPNADLKRSIARLKTWREEIGKRIELSPGLLAPNWLLERIAEQQPSNLEQLTLIQGIRQWQLNVWGNEMLNFLAKERQAQ